MNSIGHTIILGRFEGTDRVAGRSSAIQAVDDWGDRMRVLVVSLLLALLSSAAQKQNTLDIYVIDVEGGKAMLVKSPNKLFDDVRCGHVKSCSLFRKPQSRSDSRTTKWNKRQPAVNQALYYGDYE